MSLKQREVKFKPRIKLNHNIDIIRQFLIYYFGSSHEKIDDCLGDHLQTFYPSEADGRVVDDPNSFRRT